MADAADSQVVSPFIIGVGVIIVGYLVYRYYYPETKKQRIVERNWPPTLIDPQLRVILPLIEKEVITHDTRRFRFGLPSKFHILGLPIGRHINVVAQINDDMGIRSYTPITDDETQGYVDLIIKVYFKNVHPKFPEGGKMSQYIDNLKIGDTIDVRGPAGQLTYEGNGLFLIRRVRGKPAPRTTYTHVNMIAGGTGITPMLQLIRYVTKHEPKGPKLRLLFANQTERDIILRQELEDVQQKHPEQFKLWYTLDTPPENWQYSSGFINEQMIKDNLFPPAEGTLTLMCGPPPMIKNACIPNLQKLGHNEDSYFSY